MEDVLLELWAKVAAKDHKFDPSRGKYISYVGSIVETELHRIRDRTKTVRPPGNSAARLREYADRTSLGTITPGQEKTANDIRRVNAGQTYLGTQAHDRQEMIPVVDRAPSTEEASRRSEERAKARTLASAALGPLTLYESRLLGDFFGLWGHPPLTHGEIARSRRRSVATIRKQIDAALAKCGEALKRRAA